MPAATDEAMHRTAAFLTQQTCQPWQAIEQEGQKGYLYTGSASQTPHTLATLRILGALHTSTDFKAVTPLFIPNKDMDSVDTVLNRIASFFSDMTALTWHVAERDGVFGLECNDKAELFPSVCETLSTRGFIRKLSDAIDGFVPATTIDALAIKRAIPDQRCVAHDDLKDARFYQIASMLNAHFAFRDVIWKGTHTGLKTSVIYQPSELAKFESKLEALKAQGVITEWQVKDLPITGRGYKKEIVIAGEHIRAGAKIGVQGEPYLGDLSKAIAAIETSAANPGAPQAGGATLEGKLKYDLGQTLF